MRKFYGFNVQVEVANFYGFFYGNIIRETPKAYLLDTFTMTYQNGQHQKHRLGEIWVPKSQVSYVERFQDGSDSEVIIQVPEWLAVQNGGLFREGVDVIHNIKDYWSKISEN